MRRNQDRLTALNACDGLVLELVELELVLLGLLDRAGEVRAHVHFRRDVLVCAVRVLLHLDDVVVLVVPCCARAFTNNLLH